MVARKITTNTQEPGKNGNGKKPAHCKQQKLIFQVKTWKI
jgi:hypothetical protein